MKFHLPSLRMSHIHTWAAAILAQNLHSKQRQHTGWEQRFDLAEFWPNCALRVCQRESQAKPAMHTAKLKVLIYQKTFALWMWIYWMKECGWKGSLHFRKLVIPDVWTPNTWAKHFLPLQLKTKTTLLKICKNCGGNGPQIANSLNSFDFFQQYLWKWRDKFKSSGNVNKCRIRANIKLVTWSESRVCELLWLFNFCIWTC